METSMIVELKKYKEEQPLKLGMMLCKHYNCYDINEVLKKVSLSTHYLVVRSKESPVRESY
ncbi:hypothetical protein [Enterococcus lactis]|uniref:hypothetical protein n=1 Tax=Enterococcus lactis TaxID=357441 RepID=UPI001BCAEDFC|nr:hypothetical protein [Enterococcus lactis]